MEGGKPDENGPEYGDLVSRYRIRAMKSSISSALSLTVAFFVLSVPIPVGSWLSFNGPSAALAQSVKSTREAVPSQGTLRAQALEIAKIRKLQQSRRWAEALRAANRAVRKFPGNTQLRFLQGVSLSNAGKAEQAIAAFEALARDHPELAEPYNNLAVLHAGQGDLDAARAALIAAIRVVPDYPLALQNLGDVYLRMAERSYLAAIESQGPTLILKRKLSRARAVVQSLTQDR